MKSALRTICILTALWPDMTEAYSQQYDRHWLGGKHDLLLQGVFMRFEEDSISYHIVPPDVPEIEINEGILAMSNADGELQFFTNGNVVASWDSKIIEGGKGFNKGATNDDFLYNPPWSTDPDTTYNSGYNPYTYRIIPDAYDDHIYYMIHAFVIEGEWEGMPECSYFHVPKYQISKIDMSANGGKGKVVYKNHYFDQELMGAAFVLIRHGNGRDWWVVVARQDGLAYRSILLHRDTVVKVVPSAIPGLSTDWFSCNDWLATNGNLLIESMDGSRLLDNYGEGKAKLLAFDRCSGEVSLIDTFSTGITPLQFPNGAVNYYPVTTFQFSPSGRYLYGAGYAEFAQWDLEAADIGASKVKLGGVPWALDEEQNVMVGSPWGATAFAPGPDGKVYNLWRTAHSVIHYPDEKGEDCGLCLAADNAPGSCLGPDVPHYLFSNRHPNYRLGALVGSGCDTILSSTGPPVASSGYVVTASPTVASGPVEVAITLPSYGSTSTAELQVVDMLGRVLHQHRFPPYAYLHTLDVSGWQAGVYSVVLLEKGRPRAGARLVVGR